MNKPKLISNFKYELMAIFGGLGSMCTDHKLLFPIYLFICFIGIVGITAQVIAIIVFKKLVLLFDKLEEQLEKIEGKKQ